MEKSQQFLSSESDLLCARYRGLCLQVVFRSEVIGKISVLLGVNMDGRPCWGAYGRPSNLV